jgi:hypothetical protein
MYRALQNEKIRAIGTPVGQQLNRASIWLDLALKSSAYASLIGDATNGDRAHTNRFSLTQVEFLGPSGIGKSTFAAKVLRSQTLVQRLATHGIGIMSPSGIHSEFQWIENQSPTLPLELEKLHIAILEAKVRRIAERTGELPFSNTVLVLRDSLRHAYQDIRLRATPDMPLVILEDDGLLHREALHLPQIAADHPDAFRQFISGRIALRFNLPTDRIVEQAASREAQGDYRINYVGRSKEDIAAAVQLSQKRIDELVTLLTSLGVPTLEVDLSRDHPILLGEVEDFIVEMATTSRQKIGS